MITKKNFKIKKHTLKRGVTKKYKLKGGSAKKINKAGKKTGKKEPSKQNLVNTLNREFSSGFFLTDDIGYSPPAPMEQLKRIFFQREIEKNNKKVNKLSSVGGIQKQEKSRGLMNAIGTGLSEGRGAAATAKSFFESTRSAISKGLGQDVPASFQGLKSSYNTVRKSGKTHNPSTAKSTSTTKGNGTAKGNSSTKGNGKAKGNIQKIDTEIEKPFKKLDVTKLEDDENLNAIKLSIKKKEKFDVKNMKSLDKAIERELKSLNEIIEDQIPIPNNYLCGEIDTSKLIFPPEINLDNLDKKIKIKIFLLIEYLIKLITKRQKTIEEDDTKIDTLIKKAKALLGGSPLERKKILEETTTINEVYKILKERCYTRSIDEFKKTLTDRYKHLGGKGRNSGKNTRERQLDKIKNRYICDEDKRGTTHINLGKNKPKKEFIQKCDLFAGVKNLLDGTKLKFGSGEDIKYLTKPPQTEEEIVNKKLDTIKTNFTTIMTQIDEEEKTKETLQEEEKPIETIDKKLKLLNKNRTKLIEQFTNLNGDPEILDNIEMEIKFPPEVLSSE